MRRAVFAGVALCLTSCFSDPSAPIVAAGRYTLVSINGAALPFAFPNGVSVNAELLILDPNGTYQDIATRSDGQAVTDVGTYAIIGNRITFGDQTVSLLYDGSLDGNILTTTVFTYRERWQKQ